MIRLSKYSEEYDETLKRLDAGRFTEMRCHGDVLPDSRFVSADKEGNALAFSYLLAGQEFLVIDERADLPYYPLNLVLAAKTDDRRVIRAIDALFQAEIEYLKSVRSRHPGRPVRLRIWCDERSSEYLQYVISFGFTKVRRMLRMERETEKITADPDGDLLPHSLSPITDITEMLSDPAVMASYIAATEEAFGFPDSPAEMRFRIRYDGARVYTLEEKSFVTVWAAGEGVTATENVFTKKAFRRQGYARKLLLAVNRMIARRGGQRARLTVYEDDEAAIRLYESLGYRKTAVLLEMHF